MSPIKLRDALELFETIAKSLVGKFPRATVSTTIAKVPGSNELTLGEIGIRFEEESGGVS